MTKFEEGKKYYCTSVCDQNCRWEYIITKRTDKSVWIGKDRFKINESYNNEYEYIYPLGKYSMAPVLQAERIVKGAN